MCVFQKVLKTTTSTPPTPVSSKVEGIFPAKKSPGYGCCLQLNYAYSGDRVTKRSVTKRYFLQPRIRKSILKCRISELFTFHLKYHPWRLINDMQMSIYNRKHWHALSHSLHFVRHEGSLATIGRTRLTRSMAANEPGFYIPAAELVALAIAGCLQDGQPDGH